MKSEMNHRVFLSGRQEKKVVNERRREIKRLKSEQEDVSYWKVRFPSIIHQTSFLLEYHMDISWCIISSFYYLYFIYVLYNSERIGLRKQF